MLVLNQIIIYAISVVSTVELFLVYNYTWMISMTPLMMIKVRKSLFLHEGHTKFPYVDSVGKITIGVGYNLSDRGLSDEWINNQFLQDVNYFYSELSKYSWFETLNEDRQIVLIDMAFMGIKTFASFKKMIDAIKNHDFVTASEEMLASKWAKQVKDRAVKLALAMKMGVYDV